MLEGAKARGSKVVICDLRGNVGGSAQLAESG